MNYRKDIISPCLNILSLCILVSSTVVSQGVISTYQQGLTSQYSYPIGSLSAKWESGNRGPGTISTSYADPGGMSYGTYQISTKHGYLKDFLETEGAQFCDAFHDTTPGTEPFNLQWKSIAEKEGDRFHQSQHQYIKRTHFAPFIRRLNRQLKLDVNNYSPVLQDVIWSTAVQHGPYSNIIKNALGGKHLVSLPEEELIRCIYKERAKVSNGKLVYFPRVKEAWQSHLLQRFDEELEEALSTLAYLKNSNPSEEAHIHVAQSELISSQPMEESYLHTELASIDNSSLAISYEYKSTVQPQERKRNYSPANINIVKRTRALIKDISPVTPKNSYSYVKSNKKFDLKQEYPIPSYRILLLVLDNSDHVFKDLPEKSVYVEHDAKKSLYKYYVGKHLSYADVVKLESLVYYSGVRVGRIVEY